MAYNKTTWVDGSEPAIDAAHLNNAEDYIETLDLRMFDTEAAILINSGEHEINTLAIATNAASIVAIEAINVSNAIIRTGTFSGTWSPTLSTTFGITSYGDYNWSISVHQTSLNSHNNAVVTTTGVLAVDGNTINFVSTSNATAVAARYQLIGIKKVSSNYATLNQA